MHDSTVGTCRWLSRQAKEKADSKAGSAEDTADTLPHEPGENLEVAEDDPNNGDTEQAEEEHPEFDETIEEVFDHQSLEYFDPECVDFYMMDDDEMPVELDDSDPKEEQKPDTAKNQKVPSKETVQPDNEAGEVVSDEDQQPEDKTSKGTHKDRNSLAHFLTWKSCMEYVPSACTGNIHVGLGDICHFIYRIRMWQ